MKVISEFISNHRAVTAAEIDAKANAPTIKAARPTPPTPGSPEGTRPTPIAWADDAEAKALLAEAAALIEGNAEAPAPK